MYFMSQDVKGKEGNASPYGELVTQFMLMMVAGYINTENPGKGSGGTDKAMTSSDVAAAVSVPKPNKERLTASAKD